MNDVNSTAPGKNNDGSKDPQDKGATSLLVKLAAKYGQAYVKKTLPKKIYIKVAPYIGKAISQEKFTKIWNNSIGVASGAALETSISKGLQSMGVKKGTATTVASIVSTTVAVLV
ncbi:MAG TPA: hypothetical protein H9869_03040 [Candidatus Ligilactobacillus excrementipullorum]|nr:hypothetical protein [Candidatus Ligilactobacillus excrementipullorum]